MMKIKDPMSLTTRLNLNSKYCKRNCYSLRFLVIRKIVLLKYYVKIIYVMFKLIVRMLKLFIFAPLCLNVLYNYFKSLIKNYFSDRYVAKFLITLFFSCFTSTKSFFPFKIIYVPHKKT